VELFEARTPKGSARLAKATGVIRIGEDEGKGIPITVIDDKGEEHLILLPSGSRPKVSDGQNIEAGQPVTDGPWDPKEIMEILGIRQTQQYLVEEVQKVYRDQGVQIHDKHIELIVRQMTRRVGVQEPGDAGFLPGERVDAKVFRDTNRAMVESGKRPAEGRPEIMGITKASLATDSWLSAASFQETTRVLTEAAIDGRADSLVGLKENIIIGKLIPAGTGMERYRYFDIDAPDYVPMEYFSSDEADPAAYLAGLQGNLVVDDNAVFQDLAEEDEVLETLVTVPEEELAPAVEAAAPEAEVVAPEAHLPEVETVSVDEVTSEEEPPETSAL
jgi:DNA-directed RNA polymerase subunit beta'